MRSEPPRLLLPTKPVPVPGVFWRPNEAFVDELSQWLHGKRVLEIFAGNGYLSGWLTKAGVAVQATSVPSGHDLHVEGFYHPVIACDAVTAVKKWRGDSDVLLMSWPTVTNAVALAAVLWGADKPIVFIGERTRPELGLMGLGGCATDEFFELVEEMHRFSSYRGNLLEVACVLRLRSP